LGAQIGAEAGVANLTGHKQKEPLDHREDNQPQHQGLRVSPGVARIKKGGNGRAKRNKASKAKKKKEGKGRKQKHSPGHIGKKQGDLSKKIR